MLGNKTRSETHASLVSIRLRVLGSFSVLVRVSRFNRARTINHQYLVWLFIGNIPINKLTNHLLLLAKYYIYCCSITEETLLLSVYLTLVVNKAEIEKQIVVSVNSPEYYYNKWKPLIERTFVR